MFYCFDLLTDEKGVKGISLISTHVKALRREILILVLKKLWHFADRKPYHWSDLSLASETSLHLLSPLK